MAGENFGGVRNVRKLVEKTLTVGRGKGHSIFELTRPHNFWWIKLWWIGNESLNLPKFSTIKVLCYAVATKFHYEAIIILMVLST